MLKTLLEESNNVLLLEKEKELGGIWKNNIPEWQTIQNSPHDWSIHGVKLKKNNKKNVVQFIEDYIEKHNLKKYTRTKINVIDCKFIDNYWFIYTKNKIFKTNNLIIATGQHNNRNYPKLNYKDFKGKYFHSQDLKDISILKDKNIAVVGSKASSLDAIKNCLENKSKSINWIYRKLNWFGSSNVTNSNGLIFFSILQLLKIPNSLINKILQNKYISNYKKFNATQLIPKYNFNIENDIVIPGRNIILKENKNINYFEDEILSFEGNDIILKSNKKIKNIDILILGTGYKMSLPFLNYNNISFDELYLGIIHKKQKNLFFIGPSILDSTSSTPISGSILAKAIRNYINGNLKINNFKEHPKLNHFDFINNISIYDKTDYNMFWRIKLLIKMIFLIMTPIDKREWF